MTRPLFDPEKMAGPPKPPPPRDDSPLTVTAAAALISGVLEKNLPTRLRIVGEVSGLNDRTHWYFRLKDEGAVIDCVMFNAAARRVGFKPSDGQKVVLTGRIEFYAKQGRTQFYAEAMESVGAGELEMRFRALCAELKALGWFDAERKRNLPTFPGRIAVVTSKTGAALQDVLVTTARRCPAVEIVTVDVRVQGDGAAEQIATAIRWLSSRRESLGIDAILVTRGGGSMEDLWAFNERAVAHAIIECSIPVVAAIGHETDTTIAELVADARAATPTQAAMLLTPDRAALAEELEQKFRRLRSVFARLREQRRERLRGLIRRPVMTDPRHLLDAPRRRIDELARHLTHAMSARTARAHVRLERVLGRFARAAPEARLAARRVRTQELASRLARAMTLAIERRRSRAESLERELIVAGPASVLARGYSVTTAADGSVIRSANAARSGQPINTRVADGSFRSVVEGGEKNAAPPIQPAALPARRRRAKPDAPEQMKLF